MIESLSNILVVGHPQKYIFDMVHILLTIFPDAKMPGQKRKYRSYSPEAIEMATMLAREGSLTLREASAMYAIPIGTLSNKMKGKHMNVVGRQTVFDETEEKCFVHHLLTVAEWGFPMDRLDLAFMVKAYLDRIGRVVKCFRDNIPGKDWVASFLKRYRGEMSLKKCPNLKATKAHITADIIHSFFDNLNESLSDVPPSNIFNFDETGLCDDPARKHCIFKRGTKYPERLVTSSKANISLMFCGSAEGKMLPPYVVYKSENLWNTWVTGGPANTRYNRSQSGWFDRDCFEDWFENTFLPYAKQLDGAKVLIGDNLSSHFSPYVIELAEENNVKFVCLPGDTTHILQPLDVAFFGPLKRRWKDVLVRWKHDIRKRSRTIAKHDFPSLLKELCAVYYGEDGCRNIISGFEKCGLYPLNRQKVLSRLPSRKLQSEEASFAVSSVVVDMLNTLRCPPETHPKKRKVCVTPGKSISADEIQPAVSDKSTKTKRKSTTPSKNSADKQSTNDLPPSSSIQYNSVFSGVPETILGPTQCPSPQPNPCQSITWSLFSEQIRNCTTYQELEHLVSQSRGSLELDPLLNPGQSHSVVSTRTVVDKLSLAVLPKSAPDGLMPIITTGYGNCFPRSLSVLVYGSEDHHTEMRARIVFEAVINKVDYLNDSYLSVGTEQSYARATLPIIYAQYSDSYIPRATRCLTYEDVRSIYEKEILTICKDGTEMGIWQLFQAANVLGSPIVSLYPENTSPHVRVDLHRTAYPLAYGPYKQMYHIMWTYFRRIRPGFPRHFVPLIPLYVPEEKKPDETPLDSCILYDEI